MHKHSFAILWIVAFALNMPFWSACSNSEFANECENASNEGPEIKSYKGFVKILSAGKRETLGTNLEEAKADEKPQMKVTFDYDFSIQRSEVTCGDFNSLMKKSLEVNCQNDSLPVTDVTFYDAVLYANAKSKMEHLDSAYKYVSKEYDAEGHCVGLEGFSFLSEADGFRLPTEAEWVFAGNLDWDDAKSWNAENSDYKLHPVCSKTADSLDVCDMMGNAMEWVNDWLGRFKDTTVANFVGSPDGGALGERVVKGGSYKNSASSINLYSRGDVYSVVSSSHADYIGFRLAQGPIPQAVWMNSQGKTNSSKMTVLSNSTTVEAVTGSFETKLAFRNDVSGNLAFVDYANGVLSVTEIEDTLDVYHPEISPDGKRVAFCTGLEGVSGNSTLYVRNLDAKGSGLVKLKNFNAAIPRWRILENGDTVIVFVNDAGNNSDESTWMQKSTWQVRFANGKFDTPKKLLDGSFHGGVSTDNRLAVTGSKLLRARVAKKGASLADAQDELWYDGEQACNVSLAKDDSKRTLFLDFGGKTGKEFVGENYSVHERIFVADSTGKLIQSVAAPKGYSFDHSEWTWNVSDTANKLDAAVATLTNANGAHSKIVLVNFADEKITELVEGEELWHPNLWVKSTTVSDDDRLDADSAGVYYSPLGDDKAVMLRYKMELLWKYRDSSEVVVLGSSRSLNGIDPAYLNDSYHAVNLSNAPNSIYESMYLLEHYILPHYKKLKYIVFSLDLDMWWKMQTKSVDNFFYSEYKKFPGYIYDKRHHYWIEDFPQGLEELTHRALGIDFYAEKFLPTRGFNDEDCVKWNENPKTLFDSTWYASLKSIYKATLDELYNMVSMAEDHHVKLIGVIFPQNPNYKNTGAFGRYGLRRSEVNSFIVDLKKKSVENRAFILMDENKMGNHDYGDYDSQNDDHLCRLGAQKLTKRLNTLLESLE